MSTQQFATELLAAVNDLRSRGRKTVRLEHLEQVLKDALAQPEGPPDQASIERFKAELQQWNDSQQRNHEIDMENFKVVIAAGQSAIKTMLLINGGAAVAMLAFLGNLADKPGANLDPFALAMAPFGFGVLLAGTTSGLTYLTQFMYAGDAGWRQSVGHFLNGLAILAGTAGFAAFGLGMWWTYSALIA